jgi:hypothetical protein
MLIPKASTLTFRYLDTRSAPTVFGIALKRPTIHSVGGAGGSDRRHIGKTLSTPFLVHHYDQIQLRDKTRVESEVTQYKRRRAKTVLRKWNIFSDPEPSSSSPDRSSVDSSNLPPNCLLTFLCPVHATAQADALHRLDQIDATATELSLTEAKYLGDHMNVPLCVIISSASDLDTREVRVEMYMRVPTSWSGGGSDPLRSGRTFGAEVQKRRPNSR